MKRLRDRETERQRKRERERDKDRDRDRERGSEREILRESLRDAAVGGIRLLRPGPCARVDHVPQARRPAGRDAGRGGAGAEVEGVGAEVGGEEGAASVEQHLCAYKSRERERT